MNLPPELTNWEEFNSEVLKPCLVVILLHLHWIALLGLIAYVIYDIGRYLSTG